MKGEKDREKGVDYLWFFPTPQSGTKKKGPF